MTFVKGHTLKPQLDRPVTVFDLETTGIDPFQDRIVTVGVVRLEPDFSISFAREWRVNPGVPIPAAAANVHGIRDEDVRDAPPLAAIADDLLAPFTDAVPAGFNVLHYDLPLIVRDFERHGIRSHLRDDSPAIDVMQLFHRHRAAGNQPRRLEDAVRLYLNRRHEDAHGALADARATAELLPALIERHDLPTDTAALCDLCISRFVDPYDDDGRLVRRGDDLVLTFGKHRGRSLRELAGEDPGYLRWMLTKDFSDTILDAVRDALEASR